MFDKKLQPLTNSALSRLAAIAVKNGVSADLVSVIGFFIGILSALLVALGYFYLALIFFIINRILDGLDGAIARTKTPSYRGGFIDIVFDFIIYSSVPFAFAVYDESNALAACFLIFSFIGTGTSFLAYGIIQAQLPEKNKGPLNQKSFFYLDGLIEGGETIIFVSIIMLFPSLFSTISFVFGCLCWISTIFRIYVGWRDFSFK